MPNIPQVDYHQLSFGILSSLSRALDTSLSSNSKSWISPLPIQSSSHPVLPLFHIQYHHSRLRNFPLYHSLNFSLNFNLTLLLPTSHLPLLFHAHHLLEYMFYFIPSINDRMIVSIAGSTCLFSVLISFLILIDPLSLQLYQLIQL